MTELEHEFLIASILALVTHVIKIIWDTVLQNYFLKWTSDGMVDVLGSWRSVQPGRHTPTAMKETMKIKQFGRKLKGIIEYEEVGAATPTIKEFGFDGIIRGDILAIKYWNKNKSLKGGGTFTLMVIGQGTELKGKYAWYNTTSSKIESGNYKWERLPAP